MKNQYQNLTEEKQKYLFDLLPKFEELLHGTLCTCKINPAHFKLKEKSELI